MKKAIIIRKRVPEITKRKNHKIGGVGNYYRAISKHLPDDIGLFYFYNNRRNQNLLLAYFYLLASYIRVFVNIASKKTNLYMLNTSLDKLSVFRDGLTILFLKIFQKKYIVFFRGWHPSGEERIKKYKPLNYLFKHTFLRADHLIVLSSEFKTKLIDWGYTNPVSIETTAVNESLLLDYSPGMVKEKEPNSSKYKFLYLGNIIKSKGLFDLLEAIKILKNKGISGFEMIIGGEGKHLEDLKFIVEKEALPVTFLGYIKGEQKTRLLSSADFYVFPSHHEGMPNAVLEAIAFGIPVLTTRVGGIPDFFEEEKMGFYIKMKSPENIADKIEYVLSKPDLRKRIGSYNFNYAKENFYASVVAKRLSSIIYSVYDSIEPNNP